MAKAVDYKCPRFPSDEPSAHPTLCLVCGLLMCSQSYCCGQEDKQGHQLGPCAHHSNKCCYTHGVFLRFDLVFLMFLLKSIWTCSTAKLTKQKKIQVFHCIFLFLRFYYFYMINIKHFKFFNEVLFKYFSYLKSYLTS